jgi:hypothetical protein
MDVIVAIFAGVSFITVVVVSIILFVQAAKFRNDVDITLRDVVDQINYANRYAYKYDKIQEDNIRNMDVNIQSLRTRLDMLYPNNQQICIGTSCMDKDDLAEITSRLGATGVVGTTTGSSATGSSATGTSATGSSATGTTGTSTGTTGTSTGTGSSSTTTR